MTTATWSTTNQANSDALFRALGAELNGYLAAVGLTQTANTGQINWTTVSAPTSANTYAGYEIWAFNDALQATVPIYVKIEYGMGGTASPTAGAIFSLRISFASSTNGAGTLTGTASGTQVTSTSIGATVATVGVKSSYLCYKDGFLGLAWKVGGLQASAQASFAICRTCDSSGAWTGDGAVMYVRGDSSSGSSTLNNTPKVQAVRFASTAQVFTASTGGGFCLVPHLQTASVGGNNPVYMNWMPIPDMVPVLGIVTHVTSQYSLGTFTATMVGTTPRTYMTLGPTTLFGYGAADSTTAYNHAMLWE